ncbi:MAG: protein kinase domain-containing protein [Planctomycetaceae bacterium]
MNTELQRRAEDIVLTLSEATESDRDRLRNELCASNAELRQAVDQLWLLYVAAEQKGFLDRPVFDKLSPSAIRDLGNLPADPPSALARPGEPHDEPPVIDPASQETADELPVVHDTNIESPQEADNAAQPSGSQSGSQDSQAQSASAQSSQRAQKRTTESTKPPTQAPKVPRFIPKDVLGQGGQGEVWFALDPELGRHVALKVFKPVAKRKLTKATKEMLIAGFNRESEITGKLEHPNIVPVYEAGLAVALSGQPDESAPFYTMRAFGDRRWLKALEAFHARPRSDADRALIEATKAFHDDRSDSNRQTLEAQWKSFAFESQHACDRDLKEAVRGLLDETSDSMAGTLQQAIDQFHAGDWSESKLRDLLERFIDVCNALAYAHDRGVIHRDLKPANVMLGEFGETLVADWGLAKIVGRDEAHRENSEERTVEAEEDPNATRIGAIKGTYRYMSPEQANGHNDTLGPASDIYSLGAILFCILTGQPPVIAKPRSPKSIDPRPAANEPSPRFLPLSDSDILTRVRENEFPHPTKIDPRVPKALEAIILKAMSTKTRDRYTKAKHLAADVRRWLADEPVTAWPEPWHVQAKRWVKNHQTAVTSTAAAVLMAAVTLSVMFVVVTGQKTEIAKLFQSEKDAKQRERDAKELAQQNEQRAIAGEADATAAKLRAETNATAASEQSELALSTLNAVIVDIQGSLKNVPGGATVRNRLLTNVLPQLDKVSTQFAKKSAIDRNTMFAMIQLADTIQQLGRSPVAPRQEPRDANNSAHVADDPTTKSAVLTAERLLLRAHEIGKQLAAAAPDDAKAQRNLSTSFIKLGSVFLKLGRTADALTHFQDGLKIRRVLAEADPNDAQKQSDLADSFDGLGDVFLTLGRTDDALTHFQDGMKIRRVMAEADPNDAQKQSGLAYSFKSLGDVFLKVGRTDEALTQFQACEKIHRVLAEADPNDAEKQRDLSISCARLGEVFLNLGRTDDALTQFQAYEKLSRVLAEADPNDARKQRNLAYSFRYLGDVFLTLGRTDDALTQVQAYEKLSRVLAEADPNDAQKQSDLSFSFHHLGDVYRKLGRTDDALTQFQAYEKLSRVLAEADPNNAQKQRSWSTSIERIGMLFEQTGKTAKALDQYQQMLVIKKRLADNDPADSLAQRELGITYTHFGDVFLTLGRTDEALTQFQDALKIRRVLAEADPNDAEKQSDLAYSFTSFGDVFLKLGRTDEALTQFQDRLKICRVLAEADPNDALKQRDLSTSIERIGMTFERIGNTAKALDQYQQMLVIKKRLADTDPADSVAQRELGKTYRHLGDVFLALGRTDDALTQFQDGLKISRVLAETDPNDAENQSDLAFSFISLGDVFLKLGRTDDARTQFQDGLKISRVLAEADPKHTDNQLSLSVSFDRLGKVFLKLGRTADALVQFQDGLKISRVLAEADPNDAQNQRNLSIFLDQLGEVYLKLGRTDDALTQFQDRLKISRVLAEADPNSAEKQRDLMVSHYKLGEVEVQAGRFDAARERFQAGVAVLDRMIAKKQNAAASQQDKTVLEGRIQFCAAAALATGDWDALLKTDAQTLPNLLSIRATELAKRGQLTDVVQAGDKLRELAETAKPKATGLAALFAGKEPRKHDLLYRTACAYGLCATLSLKDKPQPTEAEQTERKKYIDRSLACLKEAVAAGYDDFEHMQQDSELTPLRELPEFQAFQSEEKQHNLVISHYKLGEVEMQAGRYEPAKKRFQAGIEVLDRMIANGQNVAASKQQKSTLENHIRFCNDATLATGDWDTLLKEDAKALPSLLSIRATELSKRGQQAEVAQAGAKLRDLATSADPGPAIEQKGGMLYGAACAYGLCATLSLKDKPKPTDSEKAEQQKYLDLSLACLKESVAAGWTDFDHIQQDSDLTSLRELPEFKALLKQRPEKKP